MKPGWRTSEFWVTVVTAVVSLLVVFGVLSSEQGDSIVGAASVVAVAIINLLSGAYAVSRGKAKTSQVAAVSNVVRSEYDRLLKAEKKKR